MFLLRHNGHRKTAIAKNANGTNLFRYLMMLNAVTFTFAIEIAMYGGGKYPGNIFGVVRIIRGAESEVTQLLTC